MPLDFSTPPTELMFGTDPEFMVAKFDAQGRERGYVSATSISPWNERGTQHRPMGTTEFPFGSIGTDGAGTPAEMSVLPAPTLERMWEHVFHILKDGVKELKRARGRGVRSPGETLRMKFGAMAFSGVPTGGHFHITSKGAGPGTDPMRWKWPWNGSPEAMHTLPFFISVASFFFDRHHWERVGSYGRMGDIHPSPGQESAHGASGTRGYWSGGWKGYEYRTPPTWISPSSPQFRDTLFKTIYSVVKSSADEKVAQAKYLHEVFRALGIAKGLIGDVDIPNQTIEGYNEFRGIIQERATRAELTYTGAPLGGHIAINRIMGSARGDGQPERIARAMLEVKDQFREQLPSLEWFWPLIVPDRVRDGRMNEPSWYPPTGDLVYPQVAPPGIIAAINAIEATYATFVATRKHEWMEKGRIAAGALGVTWETQIRGGVSVERDPHVSEISLIASEIARRVIIAIVPRRPDETHAGLRVIGGRNERPSFLTQPGAVMETTSDFAFLRPVRDWLGAEEMSVTGTASSGVVFLKLAFRENPTDFKYKLLALYILYNGGYIAPGAGEAAARYHPPGEPAETAAQGTNARAPQTV